jgi:hypothetical protein
VRDASQSSNWTAYDSSSNSSLNAHSCIFGSSRNGGTNCNCGTSHNGCTNNDNSCTSRSGDNGGYKYYVWHNCNNSGSYPSGTNIECNRDYCSCNTSHSGDKCGNIGRNIGKWSGSCVNCGNSIDCSHFGNCACSTSDSGNTCRFGRHLVCSLEQAATAHRL